jgi:hypothetical protein
MSVVCLHNNPDHLQIAHLQRCLLQFADMIFTRQRSQLQ